MPLPPNKVMGVATTDPEAAQKWSMTLTRRAFDVNDPWAGPVDVPVTGLERFGTVMVTGHRPEKLSGGELAWSRVALPRAVARLRFTYGAKTAISGMALGADTWFATSTLSAGMDLHAYVPFESQAAKWSTEDQETWRQLRAYATHEVIVNPDPPAAWKFHARNDAMLDATLAAQGLVVALLRDGATGGTASTFKKAQSQGLPVLWLDPGSRRMVRVGW